MEFPSSDDDNDNDDDNENNGYSDDEQIDQHPQQPLPYNALQINYYITDDLFSGQHSKIVFHRTEVESNLNIRLSVQDELLYYINHFLEPKLIEILSNSRFQFFLWIAGRVCRHRQTY